MILTREDSDLLPSLGTWDQPFHWSVFVVSPRKGGPGMPTLIAVGTIEKLTARGPTIDITVVDLMQTEPTIRPVMTGQGALSRNNRVKLTPGDVLIHPAALRGRGIGNLVFNIVTAWAQRAYPGHQAEPITLVRSNSASGAEWEHEFSKLTEFYGRFGFRWQTPPVETDRNHFPSDPPLVRDLTQVLEADLPLIRRVHLPAAVTNMIDQLHDYADDRAQLTTVSRLLKERREQWRSLGSRLNYFAWGIAFVAGVLAARLAGVVGGA